MGSTLLTLLAALVVIAPIESFALHVPGRFNLARGHSGRRASNYGTVSNVSVSSSNSSAGSLRYVENSGVCETTPGVYQASGYADLTSDKHLFFWFFEARNDPEYAPLVLWLNGGPGASSLLGLFQEHGPCRISNDSSALNYNPYSWNNFSNMIYLDQPVGAGYSYGNETVTSSRAAAEATYQFLQIFLQSDKFSKYADKSLALWGESYAGHWLPALLEYIEEQNAKIIDGNGKGLVPLHLTTVGIGNGLIDPLIQYPLYAIYSQSNPYHPLVPLETVVTANETLYKPGGCLSQIQDCYNGASDVACGNTTYYCNDNVLTPLRGNVSNYDVRDYTGDYPPDPTNILNDTSFMAQIGAESVWNYINVDVYYSVVDAGDWMRNQRQNLEKAVDADIQVFIFDGDADYICNYMGVEAVVDAMQTKVSSSYKEQNWTQWTVDGKSAGQYKSAGKLSYLRVYNAGHEVPAYSGNGLEIGQAAYAFFEQMMSCKGLTST